jgi:hypothetical protein
MLNYMTRHEKSNLFSVKHHAMKTCGGGEVYFRAFMTLALYGVDESASAPGSIR